jgi:hypothetical protein
VSEPRDDIELRRLEALAMRGGTVVASRLGGLLADDDWRVRKQAAETASQRMTTPGVLEMLVDGLLQSDDVGLRNASVEAFARAPDELTLRVASTLEAALARSSRTARKFVAAALVGAGEGGVAPLAALVRDEDVMTASCAVEALASLVRRGVASGTVEPLLVETLARSEPVLRLAALDGLIAVGAEVEAAQLGPLLDDAITRPSALRLLARARSASSREGLDDVARLLLSTLAHPRSAVEAALALARRSDPELPPDRRSFVDARSRAALIAAFAALGDVALTEIAAAMSARPPAEARWLARLALDAEELRLLPAVVELGARAELDPACRDALLALGDRAVTPLIALVRARSIDDVRAASWALEAATDLAALFAVRSSRPGSIDDELRSLARGLLAQGEEVGARAAASTLARLGDASDAGALAARVGAYGSFYEAAAAAAVEAIAARASDETRALIPERIGRRTRSSQSLLPVTDLRTLLASDDPELRASALGGITSLESPDELELVALCFADEDERVLVAAVRALSRSRGLERAASAIAAVRTVVRSEIASVRAEAILTLAHLAEPTNALVLGEIVEALGDASPSVVLAGLRASSGRSGPALDQAFDAVLDHADAEVVKEALLALPAVTDMQRARAVARAMGALDHEHWSVRARAAELLGRLRAASPLHAEDIVAALSARRSTEGDELVLRAIDVALAPSSASRGSAGERG